MRVKLTSNQKSGLPDPVEPFILEYLQIAKEMMDFNGHTLRARHSASRHSTSVVIEDLDEDAIVDMIYQREDMNQEGYRSAELNIVTSLKAFAGEGINNT